MPAPAEIAVTASIDKDGGNEVIATTADVSYTVVVSNVGNQDVNVKLKPQALIRSSAAPCNDDGGDGCRLAWTVDGERIDEIQGKTIGIPRGSAKSILLTGKVPSLDTYQSILLIDELDAADRKTSTVIKVRITRKLADLGTGSLEGIGGARFIAGTKDELKVLVTNNGATTVNLRTPPMARLREDEGGGKYANFVPHGTLTSACDPKLDDLKNFPPGSQTTCTIIVPGTLGPGKYRADITIEQAGLIRPLSFIEFSVRHCWVRAILTIALGGILGMAFSFWQSNLREVLLLRARALELRTDYNSLLDRLDPATQSKAIEIANGRIALLDQIIAKPRSGQSPENAERVSRLRALLPLLSRFADLESDYHGAADKPSEAYKIAAVALTSDQKTVAEIGVAVENLEIALFPAEQRALLPFGLGRGVKRFATRLRETTRADRILLKVGLIEWFFGIISFLLTVHIAFVALWSPNGSWGSPNDYLIAILAGIAGTASGAITLSNVAAPFITRPVPRQ